MRAKSTFIEVGGVLALLSLPSVATSGVAGKSFKVPQICGTVTDKEGAVIPHAKIRITPKRHPEDARDISSDHDGRFTLPNVKDGELKGRAFQACRKGQQRTRL